MVRPADDWLARLPLTALQELSVLLAAAVAAHQQAAALGVEASIEIFEDEDERVLSVMARAPMPEE